MKNFFSKTYNSLLATFVLIAIVMAIAAYTMLTWQQTNQGTVTRPTITVAGTSDVTAKPDIATFSFSVQADGVDATTAQSASAKSINDIMDYLKKQGVMDKDIKTSGYSLYPKYKYEQRPCLSGSVCPPGNQIPDGYSVTQTITVKVRAIDKAGAILVGVGQHGATNISNLSFTIDQPDALKDQARKEAISDAKSKAQQLADDLDVHLGRLVKYSENQNLGNPYPMHMTAEATNQGTSIDVAIPTGENKITSTVNLTFELK